MSVQAAVEAIKAKLPVQRMGGVFEPSKGLGIKKKPVKYVNEARQAAFELGLKKFEGEPCGNCESTLRYVNSGGCVACQKLRSAARHKATSGQKRQIKPEFSEKYFMQGKPCKCGATLKYRTGGQCVPCARNRALLSKHKQKKRDGIW